MITPITPITPKFICNKCDFITGNKKDFKRHLLTSKHLINNEMIIQNPLPIKSEIFTCKWERPVALSVAKGAGERIRLDSLRIVFLFGTPSPTSHRSSFIIFTTNAFTTVWITINVLVEYF